MKTVILCRHSKSSWKFHCKDSYRPLNERGLRQGAIVAAYPIAKPDLIVSSPASRAYATALLYFEEQLWDIGDLILDKTLYEVLLDELIHFISNLDDSNQSVMLFGHNPGLSQLFTFLTGRDQPNMVTSSRVTLALDIEQWIDVAQGCVQIYESIQPSDLE